MTHVSYSREQHSPYNLEQVLNFTSLNRLTRLYILAETASFLGNVVTRVPSLQRCLDKNPWPLLLSPLLINNSWMDFPVQNIYVQEAIQNHVIKENAFTL